MNADCFLDSNILVYAVDSAKESASKQAIAMKLLGQANFGLSAQVMQEFYVAVTRKIKKPLPIIDAANFLKNLSAFAVVPVDYGLITEGIRNSIKFHLSYWDGAIIAGAERLSAPLLYTEDLNHGQKYGTIKVINPFLG